MTPLSGTSFYQEAIAPIVEHLRTNRPQAELFTVQLAVLPDGPYAGSVAVYANGRRVASIPTGLTAEYGPVVRALTDSGAQATCRAVLAGADDAGGTIGIWALLPSRASIQYGGPFLPPLSGHRVDVSADTAAAFGESIKSRAKRFTDRRLGLVDPASGDVLLAGSVIGGLPAQARASIECVVAADAAGHTTTCQLRLIRESGERLRVVADLP